MASAAHFLAGDGEEDGRRLRLRIGGHGVVGPGGEVDVIEDDRRQQVGRGADDDDPGALPGGECVVQAQGQRRVAKVVCGELRLPALGGDGALGQGKDPGVVDEDVQRPRPFGVAHRS